jgi:hypothetical protein
MKPLIDPAYFQQRFIDHYTYAAVFAERYSKEHECDVAIDADALYLAMKSAYDDIERYKLYHLENPAVQKSNCVKRAAYFVKWMVKCVPIRSRRFGTEVFNEPQLAPYLANTHFAISLIGQHLEAELKVAFKFSPEKRYKLAYDLIFRELGSDGLLALVQDYYDFLSKNHVIVIE